MITCSRVQVNFKNQHLDGSQHRDRGGPLYINVLQNWIIEVILSLKWLFKLIFYLLTVIIEKINQVIQIKFLYKKILHLKRKRHNYPYKYDPWSIEVFSSFVYDCKSEFNHISSTSSFLFIVSVHWEEPMNQISRKLWFNVAYCADKLPSVF